MAAYITHAQMAKETYEKLEQEKNLQIELNPKFMTTFSHGIDLSAHNTLTHTKKTQEFLLHFLKKVKTEKEMENASIIATLYGHICHFFLDTSIHPYIYYIEKGTKPVIGQFLDAHTLVESYLSAYFIEKRRKESILNLEISEFFTLPPKECTKALDEIYLETYHLKHIGRNYQTIIELILLGENLLKMTHLNNQEICETFISFQRYLKHNQLTKEEIANESHEAWRHPVTGTISSKSAMDLYLKSIENAYQAIVEVNKYLYGSQSLESLKHYFPNISYNTGIDLEENQEMKYFRQKKK